MTPPEQPMDDGEMTAQEIVDALLRNRWAGANILRRQPPRVVTLEALPTASADLRYALILIPGGAGVADAAYVCIKNASDTYEWVKFSSPDTLAALTVTGALAHSGSTLGFFGVTPTTRPGATAEIKGALAGMGLLTDGGASNLDLDGGDITCDDITAGGVEATQGILISSGGFLHQAGTVTFWNGTGQTSKPTVTGSRGGNAALQSLLSALATYGLITDSSS